MPDCRQASSQGAAFFTEVIMDRVGFIWGRVLRATLINDSLILDGFNTLGFQPLQVLLHGF